jgi:Flp pilus assembly protein TadD
MRAIAVLACLLTVLSGCGADSEQKMLTEGARSAREAASEVNTVRLISQQLLDHKLWAPSATSMVKDSEQTLDKVVSSFATRQPGSDTVRQTYDRFSDALDAASDAVVETRIALVNGNLAKVQQQVGELQKVGEQLDELGESAK